MDYNEVEAKVKRMLICRLNLPLQEEQIGSDMHIFGVGDNTLGLDSVDGLEIVVGVSSEFGVTIEEEKGPQVLDTIRSLTEYIIAQAGNA